MPNIAMCTRKDCPKARQCYRFTAIPSHRQSYLMLEVIGEQCEYFWPNGGYNYRDRQNNG